MALKLWHHVHVVNPEWHDAAPWLAEHAPLDCVAWEHQGYDTCQLLFRQADAATLDQGAGYRHYDHLGWFVEDIHGTCDELVAGGVEFPAHASRGAANPPQPGDGRMIAFARDPGGIWFELVNVIPENVHRAKIGRWED